MSGCPGQTDRVNERLKFVADAQHGHVSMTALCEKYRISRKTGYEFLARANPDYVPPACSTVDEVLKRARVIRPCTERRMANRVDALFRSRRWHTLRSLDD